MDNHDLKKIANRLRLDVVEMIHESGDGHPGPCMSIAELLAVLYFDMLNIDPKKPNKDDRDRFILSKGHACPILYAALARKGYFDYSELGKLRTISSHLQGHPDMKKTPGIDSVSGSLGNGVAIGAGMAIAEKIKGSNAGVYVVVGDGEQQEGVIWEGAMIASQQRLGNLIVFSDCNNYQSGGKVSELSTLYPLQEKWEAFGWHTQNVDGHDIAALKGAIKQARAISEKPSFIMCTTTKGKGIPYMENNNAWHKRTPTAEEVEIAKKAIGEEIWI